MSKAGKRSRRRRRARAKTVAQSMRNFLTPAVFRQVRKVAGRRKKPRWDIHPLVYVLLMTTWCCGDSAPEKFEAARGFYVACCPNRKLPGKSLDDVDWEAEVRQYESRRRPGRMDFKAMTLSRDGNRCRKCGTRVTHETSETDHIQPVNRFASYAQATTLLNLQTLCLACHREKTRAK